MKLHRPQSGALDRGSTILEFIVYIGVIGLVLTTATLFLAEMVHSGAKVRAGAEATWNARFALSRVATEIREATGVNTGASVFGSHPGTLSLSTANGATDPTVFTVTSGVLTVKQGTGPAVPLTGPKLVVTDFILDDVSVAGRTRAVNVRLKVMAKNLDALTEQRAEATVETTVRVQAKDGFGP
ncbi:MAG TPA: hypothetical protein VL500_03145 [Candidatus Eisenbacteria bacterium]|nr:hypothetical protein [Candidatus Eisenbacteria bacterium]